MTSMELMEILNFIRDKYILEATDFGQKKETNKTGSSGSHPPAKSLPFSPRKEPHHYQSRENGKRKKKKWGKFFILSAAVGLLLATLAGHGFFTQWTDYFATFLVKTREQNQYTQPIDEAKRLQTQTEPTLSATIDSPRDMDRILAYTTYFHEWMPGSFGSDAYSPYYEMKFLDLNADGRDEMVIWESTTGVVYEVVTIDNGQTVPLYSGSVFKMDEHEEEMYLCQDNTLEKFYSNPLQGQQLQEYYQVEDQTLVMVECIMQNQDNQWYRSEAGGASDGMWTEISESEAQAVQNNHVRIEVKQVSPISEETKARDKAEAEQRLQLVLKDQYPIHFYEEIEDNTLSGFCAKESEQLGFSVEITQYALLDMDGDSIPECVVDFRFGENEQVMCLVLKHLQNDEVLATGFYYRQMYQLKSDGTFRASGSEDTDGWYRLVWENMSWVMERVPEEENCESKPDAPWQIYESAQVQE